MAGRGQKWKVLAAIGLSVIVLDQWTKLLAVEHLTPGLANAVLADQKTARPIQQYGELKEVLADVGFADKLRLFYGGVRKPCMARGRLCPEVKVVEGFWSWRYAENTGAAWSILEGRRWLLLLISFLALGFVAQFLRKLEPNQGMLVVALSLILGGAIGNMIDRLYLGYVIDFILWYQGSFYWPTFNIADTAISTGLGLIGLNIVLEALEKRKSSSGAEGSVAPQ